MPSEVEDEDEEGLFSAAYEDVTYPRQCRRQPGRERRGRRFPRGEFILESVGEGRLSFLSGLARLWLLAARPSAPRPTPREAVLASWLDTARDKHRRPAQAPR